MPEHGSDKAVLPCDRCGTLVDSYDAHAVTVEPDGTYQRWSRSRAASYARSVNRTAPFLKYLCEPCTWDVFGTTAWEDADRRARLDQASGEADA